MTEYGRIHTDGSRSGGQLLLEIQSRPNLDGYYFSFEPTGNTHIDTVLGAVGFAGKMFHGTEAWDENIPHYGVGFSCISNIQNAANAAAKALSQPTQSDALRDLLCKLIWSDCYGIKDDMMANGCSHGFKPASSCPNAECKKGELEREIDAALEQGK